MRHQKKEIEKLKFFTCVEVYLSCVTFNGKISIIKGQDSVSHILYELHSDFVVHLQKEQIT